MDKASYKNSSYIASLPFICINFVASVLFAYFAKSTVAALFMLLFLFGLTSFLWAKASSKKLFCSFSYSSFGLFPGDKLYIDVKLKNDKFLPVLWTKVNDLFTEEFSFGALLWHEEASIRREWIADKRGIKHLDDRSVAVGDGFGLRQVFLENNLSGRREIAVYPARVNVDTKIFMKNLWNASTGRKGVYEDVTVIKQERPYQTTDSAKRINFRLAARNLPLSVNLYENISPRGVHFIFDGESFAIDPLYEKESGLEEALSILASILVKLDSEGFSSSMSICEGKDTPAACFKPEDSLDDMLYSLAAYENYELKRETDGKKSVRKSLFDTRSILSLRGRVSKFYYICKNEDAAYRSKLLDAFDEGSVCLLTYEKGGSGCLENIALQTLLL